MDPLDLFRRLAAAPRDDPAWTDLLHLCETEVRRTLWFRNWMPRRNSGSFIADTVQEVLSRLVTLDRRRLDQLVAAGRPALDQYLRRVVENTVCDQLRHDLVRIKLDNALAFDDLGPDLDETLFSALSTNTEENPDSDLSSREIREIVDRALRSLAPPGAERSLYRHLFQLYFVEGRSAPQIARMGSTALSLSAVSRRLLTLRRALRAVYDGEPVRVGLRRARVEAQAAAHRQVRLPGRRLRRRLPLRPPRPLRSPRPPRPPRPPRSPRSPLPPRRRR